MAGVAYLPAAFLAANGLRAIVVATEPQAPNPKKNQQSAINSICPWLLGVSVAVGRLGLEKSFIETHTHAHYAGYVCVCMCEWLVGSQRVVEIFRVGVVHCCCCCPLFSYSKYL